MTAQETPVTAAVAAADQHSHNQLPVHQLWCLPGDILFAILQFAALPTHRTAIVCQQLAPLCQDSYSTLLPLDKSPMWDLILKQDCGEALVQGALTSHSRRASKRNKKSVLVQRI